MNRNFTSRLYNYSFSKSFRDIHVLDQPNELNLYNVYSVKQQTAGRHVVTIGKKKPVTACICICICYVVEPNCGFYTTCFVV